MSGFEKSLSGGDLRSIGKSNEAASIINNQEEFDNLFGLLFHSDRLLVMRAADTIEKITIRHPEFLHKHKAEIIPLYDNAKNKELKWHLAQIAPRLHLNKKELGKVWGILSFWAGDSNESRITRANSIQGLWEMSKDDTSLRQKLKKILEQIKMENVPSLRARVKKLRKDE